MRYGVCTWTFGDLSLVDVAARIARLGFDGLELFGDLTLDAQQTRALLEDHGLAVLSLTPKNVDLAHPDVSVRTEALDHYLRLLDLAVALGAPLISCHGAVGRVRPLDSQEAEWGWFVEGVQQIAERAATRGLGVALELLNRYESHLLNTTAEGLRFIEAVGAPNVGLLLDAYHMNIEEPDLPGAVRAAGKHLLLFHVADSNRQGVGRGHTDFAALMRALKAINYRGDLVLECVAPGPNPFTADKGPDTLRWLETFLAESLAALQELTGHTDRAGDGER